MNEKLRTIAERGLELYNMRSKGKILTFDEAKVVVSGTINDIQTMFNDSEFSFNDSEKKLVNIMINTKISTSENELEIKSIVSKDHKPWLNKNGQPIKKEKTAYKYDHWKRFKKYINIKQNINIDDFETQVREVLRNIEDPQNYDDEWLLRGLVVGNVQSGKTTNYIGLMNMAVDVGYKVIIVLAGAGNALRKQTQIRIEEGLTGVDSITKDRIGINYYKDDDAEYSNMLSWTSRANDGDFSSKVKRSINFSESWAKNESPILFVTKKHKGILESLEDWLQSRTEEGKRIPSPLLLIDDECDYASINTKKIDGEDDSEYDPTAINKCIRNIMHRFERASYVGYTATPYGNIFIRTEDEDGNPNNDESVYDLFPDNFILNLGSNDVYAGPNLMFPNECSDELSFYREVDYAEWDFFSSIIKAKNRKLKNSGLDVKEHKKERAQIYQRILDSHYEDDETLLNIHISGREEDGLTESIRAFILSCAVRTLRGYNDVFNTMLIHVNREKLMQDFVKKIVVDIYTKIEQEILSQDFSKFEALFYNDYIDHTDEYLKSERVPDILKEGIDPLGNNEFTFDNIKKEILDIIQKKQIVTVIQNSTKQEHSLSYEDKDKGTYYICVGGDILSRGFTMEGLSVSYFLRHAKAQDTLLQMGRWFGYRIGYLDLCRVYTTAAINEDLSFTTAAQKELFETFDYMSKEGLTPRDFGLKIANSKGSLQVTGFGKRRTAADTKLDFTKFVQYGKYMHLDKDIIKSNAEALKELVWDLKREKYKSDLIPSHIEGKFLTEFVLDRYCIFNVPSKKMISFLEKYKLNTIENQQAYITKSALITALTDILKDNMSFKVIIQTERKDKIGSGGYEFFKNGDMLYPRERIALDNYTTKNRIISGRAMTTPEDESLRRYFNEQGYGVMIFTPNYGFNWKDEYHKRKGSNEEKNKNLKKEIKKEMEKIPLEDKLAQSTTYWGYGDDPILYYKLELPNYEKLGLTFDNAFKSYLANEIEQKKIGEQIEIWENYEREF